ncbi:MAG: hypothetical protein KKD74_01835 [Bacteroidetes bacterium]|nr:hypothetical protein [Bacteroidota bacterium]
MKKLSIILITLFMVPALFLTSCKKDEKVTFDSQKALTDYLVAQDLDLNKILDGFVMPAPDDGNVSAKYVIDIRTADDFALGHIEGAHRVNLADLLTEAANAAGKDILVVCKTGQTATHAVALLRLAGYPTAKALKWGMSGWNAAFDAWTPNIGNEAEGNANWTTAVAPANLTFASPKFTSTSTNGAEILNERIAAVLADGFKTTTVTDVITNPGNYFINNYFSEADYLGFGHVNGAYRIQPLLISEGQMNYLDASKRVATYCYTGQTSAAITAYLRVIGYDAVTVLFGMNKFYNNSTAWTANKWTSASPKNLPYVTGN